MFYFFYFEDSLAAKIARKDSLDRLLRNRPSMKEMYDRNILPSKTQQERTETRESISQRLERRLSFRPMQSELEQRNILKRTFACSVSFFGLLFCRNTIMNITFRTPSHSTFLFLGNPKVYQVLVFKLSNFSFSYYLLRNETFWQKAATQNYNILKKESVLFIN